MTQPFEQRPHFACFACRRALKQAGTSDSDPENPPRPQFCPDCRQPMVWLGRYFKAPPARAVRQWWKVELLYEFGRRFESGHSRLDVLASDLRSTIEYLVRCGEREEHVRLVLERIRKKRQPPPAKRKVERRPAGRKR